MGISKRKRWMWLRHKFFVLSTFWLTSLLVVLQILDWATTSFLIATLNDTDLEANPLMRILLEQSDGMFWFAVLKFGFSGFLAFFVPYSIKASPKFVWVWRLLALVYIVIVVSNLLGVATVCMLL